MADEQTTTNPASVAETVPEGKTLVKSKTFWIQVASVVLWGGSYLFGYSLTQDQIGGIIAMGVNVVTAYLTYLRPDIKSVL